MPEIGGKLEFRISAPHECVGEKYPFRRCGDNGKVFEFRFKAKELDYILSIPGCLLSCGGVSRHQVAVGEFEVLTGHRLAKIRGIGRVDEVCQSMEIPTAYHYYPRHSYAFKTYVDECREKFFKDSRCPVCGLIPESVFASKMSYRKKARACSLRCECKSLEAIKDSESKTEDAEMKLIFSMGKVMNHAGN